MAPAAVAATRVAGQARPMRGVVAAMIATMIAAVAALAFTGPAAAQTFPTRPVTMIVPYSAGGPTDTIARVIGERMARSLGQNVVIENITGASGTIAAANVDAAPPRAVVGIAAQSVGFVNVVGIAVGITRVPEGRGELVGRQL